MIEWPELDTPTEELSKNLVKITEILKKKANHHSSMYKVYAKDQDYILHELEKLGGITDMEESEKNKLRLSLCMELENIRSNRRVNNEEQFKLKELSKYIDIKEVHHKIVNVKFKQMPKNEHMGRKELSEKKIM